MFPYALPSRFQFTLNQDTSFNASDYNISNDEPLKIGFGEMDYFSGKMKEVRIYNRALSESDVKLTAR